MWDTYDIYECWDFAHLVTSLTRATIRNPTTLFAGLKHWNRCDPWWADHGPSCGHSCNRWWHTIYSICEHCLCRRSWDGSSRPWEWSDVVCQSLLPATHWNQQEHQQSHDKVHHIRLYALKKTRTLRSPHKLICPLVIVDLACQCCYTSTVSDTWRLWVIECESGSHPTPWRMAPMCV